MKKTAAMSPLIAGLLLIISTTGADAGIFQDLMPSLSKTSSASTMSYPYGAAEVVELAVDSWSNCAESDQTTFAETQLVCADGYGAKYTTPGKATSDPAATCEWTFVFFDRSLPIPGTTKSRVGKLFGHCELGDAVDHCSHGLDCAGMTLSIEAWLLYVPAWSREKYVPTLMNDGGLASCGVTGPSCCVLQNIFGYLAACSGVYRCPGSTGSKSGKGDKQADAGAGTGTPAAGDDKVSNQRQKRIQPADSPANVVADSSKKAAAEASTSSMGGNGDSYFYSGYAYVAHGTFTVEHAHHNHKWESKGKMSWVASTDLPSTPSMGPPPENTPEVEAGKMHLKFFKAGEYGYDYPKYSEYGYQRPKQYDDGPKHYDEPKPYDEGPKRYEDGPHERRRSRY